MTGGAITMHLVHSATATGDGNKCLYLLFVHAEF